MSEPQTKPYRWGILRDTPDWSVDVQPTPDPGPIDTDHPLASLGGMSAFHDILMASDVWGALTRRQREVLLSAAAGAPISVRADVRRRLSSRGLITVVSAAVDAAELTDAGRFVVQWRCFPTPSVAAGVEPGEAK